MNQIPSWTLGRTQMETGNLGNPANINAQISGAFDFITSLGGLHPTGLPAGSWCWAGAFTLTNR